MYNDRLAENISLLRHKKGITQEKLADFVGVTKASVSKWEKGISMPDIVVLPQLATYFGVTIDDLMGYEPQLNRAQVIQLHGELREDFAVKPFKEAMDNSLKLVKQYYNCYPFLFQICCLWLNHYDMAGTSEEQQEVLNKINELSIHIIENCDDVKTLSETKMVNAITNLLLGNANEVIDTILELNTEYRTVSQSDGILVQAYQMAGQNENAKYYTQVSMYNNLLDLISGLTRYLSVSHSDKNVYEDTILKGLEIIKTFSLDKLHPNSAANFYYQAAITCCMLSKLKEAVEMLMNYKKCVDRILFEDKIMIHGDEFFTEIDTWLEEMNVTKPRDEQLVIQTFVQSINNPAFSVLEGVEGFDGLKKEIEVMKK